MRRNSQIYFSVPIVHIFSVQKLIVYQMGRLCGGAHEISGISAPLWLHRWLVGRFMGWMGGWVLLWVVVEWVVWCGCVFVRGGWVLWWWVGGVVGSGWVGDVVGGRWGGCMLRVGGCLVVDWL